VPLFLRLGGDALGQLEHDRHEQLHRKSFGDGATQLGQAVTTDASGNVLFAGYLNGAVDFGKGPLLSAGGSDVFVAKLSP
jgi:hypothetical protein